MAAYKLKTLAGFLKQGDWTYTVASSGAAQFVMIDKSGTTYAVSKDCIQSVEKKEEVKSGLLSKEIIFEVHFTNGQSAIFKADGKAFQTIFEAQYSSKKIPTQVVETKPSKVAMIAGATLFSVLFLGMCSSHNSNKPSNEQQTNSFRTFTEKDMYLGDKEKRYASLIVKGVNKVHREHPGCSTIDPATAAIASGKGTKSNPTFFVTCGANLNAFNVYFTKADIEKNAPVKVIKNISNNDAMNMCQKAALASTMHPSTVDFGRLLDLTDHPNGNTSVSYYFEAKNSFGLKLKYRIDCLVNENGLAQEPNIVEVAD